MLGLLSHYENKMTLNFKSEGDLIYLLGEPREDIASSEYLYSYCKVKASPAPAFDLEQEVKLQEAVRTLIRNKSVNAAHDISDGGLFITLAEMGMASDLGFSIKTDSNCRKDAYLFGESQSRVVVTVAQEFAENFEKEAKNMEVTYRQLGKVISHQFIVDAEVLISIDEARQLHENLLPEILS